MTVHVAIRPTWECVGCGDQWPCPTRRRELLAESANALPALWLLLGAGLVHAARELPGEHAGVLYERFIGWLLEARYR